MSPNSTLTYLLRLTTSVVSTAIKAAAEQGWIDEKKVILETLTSINEQVQI